MLTITCMRRPVHTVLLPGSNATGSGRLWRPEPDGCAGPDNCVHRAVHTCGCSKTSLLKSKEHVVAVVKPLRAPLWKVQTSKYAKNCQIEMRYSAKGDVFSIEVSPVAASAFAACSADPWALSRPFFLAASIAYLADTDRATARMDGPRRFPKPLQRAELAQRPPTNASSYKAVVGALLYGLSSVHTSHL